MTMVEVMVVTMTSVSIGWWMRYRIRVVAMTITTSLMSIMTVMAAWMTIMAVWMSRVAVYFMTMAVTLRVLWSQVQRLI